MDQRYLNFSFAPVISLLEKSLQIELYNETYSPSYSNHITIPTLNQASCCIDKSATAEYQILLNMPSVAALFENLKISIPELETNICVSLDDLSNTVDLSNKLFLYSLRQKMQCFAAGI